MRLGDCHIVTKGDRGDRSRLRQPRKVSRHPRNAHMRGFLPGASDMALPSRAWLRDDGDGRDLRPWQRAAGYLGQVHRRCKARMRTVALGHGCKPST